MNSIRALFFYVLISILKRIPNTGETYTRNKGFVGNRHLYLLSQNIKMLISQLNVEEFSLQSQNVSDSL